MQKKRLTIIFISICSVVGVVAIICMIWLIRVCGIFVKEYYNFKKQSASYMTEEKKALSAMLEEYDELSFKAVSYKDEEEYYFIVCECNEYDINDKIYDEGIAFFYDVIDWAYSEGNEFKGSKIYVYIRDDRGQHSSGEFLELKNFTFSGKDEKFVPDECISAFIGSEIECSYSDIEEFKRKYPNIYFEK